MDDCKELELTGFGTTSLGALIEALKACGGTAVVQLDFCYLRPTTLASYRGYYDHLALGWQDADRSPYWPTVAELLDHLEAADGKVYEGWKGGEYTMRLSTPIWIDNRGEASSTAIVSIRESDTQVIINTRRVD